MSLQRYKLVFFVPKDSTQRVLNHLFSKYPQELGKIGNYDQVAFISRGTGQFRPLSGANPNLGKVGELEFVEEDRVELLVNDKGQREQVRDAVKELKNVHPYEEVGYDVYKLEDF
ncbi:unnamed protein product [Cyclocybe aegerita]|uniref:ATP phosphoribosyltransferase n=1 Tax=Cyclocybe aegerita TaxID=1973307 RepID=A0A8S0W7R2_CYCAE|nr:unnamed protein product [Cyclocybe aegerita]